MNNDLLNNLGVVVIGRNEGEQLRLCLQSVLRLGCPVVYADSGSTDGSAELARQMGAEVVELDASRPFTAARGRNAGFARLRELAPDVEFVQFVDGDCELEPDWPAAAVEALRERCDAAIVAGHLCERHPEASVYNRLCQVEWNHPAGETGECGGIFVARAEAFAGVGGFDDAVAAGEEPDLCVRLRAEGWRIFRLDAEMATHDANMTRFCQWWRRAVRSGAGYVAGVRRHGRAAPPRWVREVVSIIAWSVVLPMAVVLTAVLWTPWALLALLIYPLQVWRIRRRQLRLGRDSQASTAYAAFIMLGKLAQLVGVGCFLLRRLARGEPKIVGYKLGSPASGFVEPEVGGQRATMTTTGGLDEKRSV